MTAAGRARLLATGQMSNQNHPIMKKRIVFLLTRQGFFLALVLTHLMMTGCKGNGTPMRPPEEYPPDIAHDWIGMQQKLLAGTPGILPHVAGRTYGYVGLTLYESIAPGMEQYQSISSQLSGNLVLPRIEAGKEYFWPASLNAAAAVILRNLLPHTSTGLLGQIDSLEAAYNQQFQSAATGDALQRSVTFGRSIAEAIFEWSKSDGGHEAYKNPLYERYVAPTGPGKWVSTGELPFDQPVYPFWGDNRSFVPGLTEATQPSPPPPYSEEQGSDFYEAVNEIYTMSQSLTHDDSLTAKFWAYEPQHPESRVEYFDASHAANIATQLMMDEDYTLEEAVALYCRHAIAGNEAGISCVRTKFHYNLVRPITYIREVMGHTEWKPVVPTPPFPEYTSGHAVVSSAYATVLEAAFGKDYSFTDHSFDASYGPRKFDSFEACAREAAYSRLLAGIHYRFAMDEGLAQGREVATMVLQLNFRK